METTQAAMSDPETKAGVSPPGAAVQDEPVSDIDDVFDEDEGAAGTQGDTGDKPPPASLAGIRIRANHPRTLRVTQRKHGDLSERMDGGAPQPAAEAAGRPLSRPVPKPLQIAEARLAAATASVTPTPVAPTPVMSSQAVSGERTDLAARLAMRRRGLNPERRASANLMGYWHRLRFGRACPAWPDMDRDQIAFFWPNSVLLTCDPPAEGSQRRPRSIRSATRIADMSGGVTPDTDIAFTEPMIAWVLAIGQAVAQSAKPLEETEGFPVVGGLQDYAVLALPLMDDGMDQVTHVLCHVKRT